MKSAQRKDLWAKWEKLLADDKKNKNRRHRFKVRELTSLLSLWWEKENKDVVAAFLNEERFDSVIGDSGETCFEFDKEAADSLRFIADLMDGSANIQDVSFPQIWNAWMNLRFSDEFISNTCLDGVISSEGFSTPYVNLNMAEDLTEKFIKL